MADTPTEWTGWHFLRESRCMGYRRTRTVVEAGRTYSCEGDLKLCHNGMHASSRAIDALVYAPGPIACRVRLLGERLDGTDKSCARSREVLWMADAARTLHEFALWCAEKALTREREAGREPDPRCWEALAVKRRWLNGEASDSELAAARDAAWDAARAAARDAAWDAARDAARDAAGDAAEAAAESAALHAARDAARRAAWDAARTAAWDAARTAAWDAARTAAGDAAEAAAWDAAFAAAGSEQSAELERRLSLLAPSV